MIDTQFLAGLERFNLIVRKRVTSNLSGPRRSIAQGRGMVFKDHRAYAPGDDFRAIDWRVYARTDDLMIKNYEEERNLVVHIIVDKSLSMRFGNKFDYASMLAIGYAYLALKNNDKFQFSTFSNELDVYQPERGVSQLLAMVDYLNNMKLKGKTDILSMAQKYRKIIGSRSLIVLISDFLLPVEKIKQALYYFQENEVDVIRVLDKRETNLDMEGDFKLKDSESNDKMRAYISPMMREKYIERLKKHTQDVEHECMTRGMKFSQISTDMPIFDAFYNILGY
ncbi:DUF58 domain-containing protein [Candidatus Woesearchaeota archaeon]|nr:DUF58 domain-containing protein [Candidatus Woesearchaeota archaeon]